MFWAEIIEDSKRQNDRHRYHWRILGRHTKITDACPAAQCRGDDKIRNQQKCPDRCEKATLLPRGRIDATAIRKMGADNNIIESDDRREETNGEDDRTRGEASGDESQPEYIRLARPPITIKQCGGALPINVARPMDACGNHLGHRYEPYLSMVVAIAGKLFLKHVGLSLKYLDPTFAHPG